jgi:hypothetical protein
MLVSAIRLNPERLPRSGFVPRSAAWMAALGAGVAIGFGSTERPQRVDLTHPEGKELSAKSKSKSKTASGPRCTPK